MKLFSNIIKERLKINRKSQAELAAFMGITPTGLSKALKNEQTLERLAVKISEFLEVPLNEIAQLNSGYEADGFNIIPKEVYEKEIELLKMELSESEKRSKELSEIAKWQSEVINGLNEICKIKNDCDRG